MGYAEAAAAQRASWPPDAYRALLGMATRAAPGPIGDEQTYIGLLALGVLKFLGILVLCSSLGAFLLAAQFGPLSPFRAGPSGWPSFPGQVRPRRRRWAGLVCHAHA